MTQFRASLILFLSTVSSWRSAWLSTGYLFMVWYLVKQSDNFTA